MCLDCGICETLKLHKASWHKLCYSKFSKMKLQRAQKQKSQNFPEKISLVKTRCLLDVVQHASVSVKICLFCDQSDGSLHRASTIDLRHKSTFLYMQKA